MNFLTKIRAITDLNDKELKLGYCNTSASWHAQYKHSAWIHVGGLSYKLSEGDVICVFSQYGEIVQIHMPRDRESGKTKGFAFLCYEDTRSTVLAVDNLNGSKICDRQVKVDHVLDFKPPKDSEDDDDDDDRVGMAKDYRRRKRGYEKKKRYGDPNDPEYDHTAEKIRKEGVAPAREAPVKKDKKKKKDKKSKKSKNDDSDDGLLPYQGESFKATDFPSKQAELDKAELEKNGGAHYGEMKWRGKKDKPFDKNEPKPMAQPDANMGIRERLARARNHEQEKYDKRQEGKDKFQSSFDRERESFRDKDRGSKRR